MSLTPRRITGYLSGTPIYLLLITVLGAALVTPLLRWTSGPCTNDGHLLYHRLAALRYAWENGSVFSRWFPDVAFGYGYPFFLYREAPPLYIGLLPHFLGAPLPAAINIFYALSILAAGWFMFLWVRDVFDERAAIVSAAAYMVAPYLLTDALVLGIQPEIMALALFPFLCWVGRRYILSGTVGTFLLSTAGIALLALSHNISTLLFVPFLMIYLLVSGWLHRLNWRPLLTRWLLIFILGLGLSAFFTGPALLELDEITIAQSVNNRNNDFRFNFTTLDEIFAPVSPEDPALLNPPFLLRLGLVPAALALLGITSVFWNRTRDRRGHIIFMGLSAVVLLMMTMSFSQPLWERLPLIRFVQFPWRLIGRAALPVAFLAGVPFARTSNVISTNYRSQSYRWLLATVAVALLALEALPLLYPSNCKVEPYPSIDTVHRYEHSSGLVGVDPTGSYFPTTVAKKPEGSPLEEDYLTGREPQRFDESVLPPGARISDISYEATAVNVHLETPEPFEARYLSFAFPGWVATIDGEQVPITPEDPDGLITFPVPAGIHTVEVRWQTTQLRTVMMLLSSSAFLGVIATAVVLARKQAGEPAVLVHDQQQVTKPSDDKAIWLLLLVAISFLAFKLLIVDRVETPFRRVAPPPVTYTSDLLAVELQLEGHNLSQDTVVAGDSFDIDLAWRTIETPTANYQSNVWLVGPERMTWSDKETDRPRTFEETSFTTLWLPGQWAWDSREVHVLQGTPPGRYDIALTLFDRADLQPITLVDAGGAIIGPTPVIGQINVVRPDTQPEFEPQFPLRGAAGGLTLLGYNQDRSEMAPGENVLLTLFFEKPAEFQSPANYLELTLQGEDGNIVQSWSVPPVRADYQPAEWRVGERVRGQHLLRLAAGLDDGNYQFHLEDLPLGDLQVNGPERIFEEPTYDTVVGSKFDDLIRLAGYSVERNSSDPQSPITLTLVWQGLGEIPAGYRVFVHLVDGDGQILDQSDAEPAGWTRPTTGWAPGEFVLDKHQLDMPDGRAEEELFLRVGLYEDSSGRRLDTGGEDFIILPVNLGEG